MNTSKKIYLTLSTFALLGAFAIGLNRDVNSVSKYQIGDKSLSDSHDKPIISSAQQSAPSKAFSSVSSSSSNLSNFNPMIVQEWRSKNGYITNDSVIYTTYTDEALKELSLNGDALAIKELGKRYWVNKSMKDAFDFYEEMAARGSSSAIGYMSDMYINGAYLYATTPELKKGVALEALAYAQAAEMRGNRWTRVNAIMGAELTLLNEHMDLSQADQDHITQRAQSIYDNLQAKHTELGLGQFDNSTPEDVNNFFDSMEKSYRDYLNSEKLRRQHK